MAYSSFYTNACRLLSSINSGICHKRASVKLPLSKIGFELSCTLRNLGLIADFSVGQRVSRVKGHSRLWDPRNSSINSSDEAAGYPGMYITLYLNWDKHKPLYSKAQLAAAPVATAAASNSTAGPHAARPGFTPPMGLNSPTPEHVKIISKPSHQRWTSVQQLLRSRAASPPGIYLLSSHQGIITDIDAELRGVGGILLAHLGLPLGHVVQLRQLLRAKHDTEVAAAREQQQQQHAAAGDLPSTSSRSADVLVHHAPLSQWDARTFAGDVANSRLLLGDGRQEAAEFLNALDLADQERAELSRAAGQKLDQLQLQEVAWKQKQHDGWHGHEGHQGRADRRSRRAAVAGRSRSAGGQ